jgi:hypothetical protein
LLYLLSYSPDFSPIELAIAKLKAALRRARARNRETLEAAIAQTLASVTAADTRRFSIFPATTSHSIGLNVSLLTLIYQAQVLKNQHHCRGFSAVLCAIVDSTHLMAAIDPGCAALSLGEA